MPGGHAERAVAKTPLEELAGFRETARDRACDLVPVAPALRDLLPAAGLRRGCTVSVAGTAGATSLLVALLAEVSRAGGWCAAVGMPELGAVAAAELGVLLDRLAAVPRPGRSWPTVVAALLEGVDVVLVRPPARPAVREVRRLTARARERKAVLIAAGPWEGAELRLTATASRWYGADAGHGHLRGRELLLRAEGRGAAARPRETALWLPGPEAGTGTPVPAGPRVPGDVPADTGAGRAASRLRVVAA